MKPLKIICILLLQTMSVMLYSQQINADITPLCKQSQKSRGVLPDQSVNIKGLRAVLLVGPCESLTDGFIQEMRGYQAILEERGVKCDTFYTPDNTWEDIKKAAAGANFLLYAGHGIYDGSRPPEWVGTFYLESGFFKEQHVLEDLKLAKGAIVMFSHACFSAGGAGGDVGDIGMAEARRRVALYSKPFIQMGFSGYYSCAWYGGLSYIIANLFAGKGLLDTYKDYFAYDPEKGIAEKHPNNNLYNLMVDGGYSYAFVGSGNKTLLQLFGSK